MQTAHKVVIGLGVIVIASYFVRRAFAASPAKGGSSNFGADGLLGGGGGGSGVWSS